MNRLAVGGVLLLLLAGCGGIESDVRDATGSDVDCQKVGVMLIAGERESVFDCNHAGTNQDVGCYAQVDGELYDVSSQASALAELQSALLTC